MATGSGLEGRGLKPARSKQPMTPGCHKTAKNDFQPEKSTFVTLIHYMLHPKRLIVIDERFLH